MVPYGKADLLDYAPVARQNLATGAMSVAEMCKAIVELSDNTCANLLLARVGGPAALTAFWRSTRRHHLAARPQRARTQPLAARRSPRHHDAGGDGRQSARLRAGRSIVAGFARAAHRLDGGLQDRRQPAARRPAAGWKIGDKTGNNGKDASGDIAVVWPKPRARADADRGLYPGRHADGAQIEAVSRESAGWWPSGWREPRRIDHGRFRAKTGHDRSEISDFSDFAGGAGRHRAGRPPLQHRAGDPADAGRHRLAFVPGMPPVELPPELVLLMVLPPLIYSASVAMSWREFRYNLRPIVLLAVGCVIFTAARSRPPRII